MSKIEKQLEEYLEWCEKVRGMTEATMRVKRNVLERFVRVTGVREVGEITNEAMKRWAIYGVERGAKGRSVNMYNAVVIALVRYYREMGVMVPVNLALVGKLKEGRVRRKYYTAEEILRVVKAARECGDDVSALQITIMFETGMRIAELVELKVEDFDGTDGRRVRFIGKGRKPREVYVTVGTAKWVREYVEACGVKGYLWGCTLNGEPPTTATVRLRLKRAFEREGLEGFYPHALRHSFATDLQMRGASVAEIKEMIGHSNIATTERYMHGLEGKMRELFEKYR